MWAGKHRQAPVMVASKTHYFCELDVEASVRAVLGRCPSFLRSSQWRECLKDGRLVLLDVPFFVQVGRWAGRGAGGGWGWAGAG